MGLKTFHIGVKGVIIVDGRVLLLKRQDRWSGVFWEVPGGRMEAGEEIEETLRRELREEVPSIGQIEVGELLHAARVPLDWDEVGLVLLFYQVRAEVPEVVLSDEHLGYTWVGAEDLPALERGEGAVATFNYTWTAAQLALEGRGNNKAALTTIRATYNQVSAETWARAIAAPIASWETQRFPNVYGTISFATQLCEGR
jgi:8-oxo-dGTP pyrophosphatase MutT (NUDIX family)